jgi:choline monooxygenase
MQVIFFTTELVGEQLLVSRGQDGAVHVLSNVCRHRGNMVETSISGTRRSFVCQYRAGCIMSKWLPFIRK